MPAHKIRAIARTENGAEKVVYPETIASQVLCATPTGIIPLDELLNQYADEINENSDAIQDIRDNGGGGGSGIPLGDCTSIAATAQNGGLVIKWKDPDDVVVSGATLASWANTKLIRKQGSFPENATDGTVVMTSSVRNQYQTTGYTDTGLVNGTTYYYKLIPVSKTGAANLNAANNVSSTPQRIVIATVPSQSGTLTYTGSSQTPAWSNYDAAKMTLGGVTTGTNAGSYTATFTPVGGYEWADGSTAAKSVTWTIGRATVTTVPSQSGSLTYTGNSQTPSWSNYDAAKTPVGGTTSSTNAGTFTATFTPTSNYQWSDSTTTAKSVTWTMAKAAGSLSLSPTSLTLNATTLSSPIAVTRAGDGAITASSSNTGIATVSVSGTTVTVTNVGQTTGTTTITVNVAAGTNHNAATSTTCAVTAQFLPVKQALNSMTWADINTICQAGKASEYWSRGDTKTIALSTSESITVRIEDFEHDTLAAGGKAKMTLGMVHSLNTTRQMNSSNTNSGGWGSAAMKTFMTTLLGQLPSDLQSVIKSVTKTTSAGNNSSSLTTTSDKVWLFSHTEVALPTNTSYSPGGEGMAYPLFVSDASRIKNVNGFATVWWLRSPGAAYTAYFCDVNSSGAANGSVASYSYGVAAGFCI